MNERLWWRAGLPFFLFLMAGTLGLLLLLNRTYQRQSRAEFEQLALANAEFIRAAHIPPNDRFAGYLSQVLGCEVRFQAVPAPAPGWEAVTVPVTEETELTLLRERPQWLMRPVTWVALAAFWGMSLGLAWAVFQPWLRAQRLAMLGRMATALAHEVQNPVAAIRLHAELAGNSTIAGEAQNIEALVNQWMFLARPEPPRTAEVDLDGLLAETLSAVEPLAAHARVRIERRGQAGRVQADARRLGQVLRNLITNAIQAMPNGGTLTIAASERQLRFTDTGPGFSHRALARCPRMFYSEKEGGMGIGLSVAHEILKAHGAQLQLANVAGGGADVRVLWGGRSCA